MLQSDFLDQYRKLQGDGCKNEFIINSCSFWIFKLCGLKKKD